MSEPFTHLLHSVESMWADLTSNFNKIARSTNTAGADPNLFQRGFEEELYISI